MEEQSGQGPGQDIQQQVTKVYGSLVDRREAERLERLTAGLSESAPPWAAPWLAKAAPAVGVLGAIAEALGPIVCNFYMSIYNVYKELPKNAASCLWGLGMCFFGGRYPLSLAAIEAFKMTGGSEMAVHFESLKESIAKLQQANSEDDKRDENTDGVEDVGQISNKELFSRKVALFLRNIDPGVLSESFGGLWSGYLGILAALKMKYARTAALAHSIGDSVRPATSKFLGPTVLSLTPPEFRHWVSPAFNVACKMLGMWVAWKLQHAVSTVQSGLAGGLLAARAGLAMLQEANLARRGSDDSMSDEVVGMALAAGGIYYQFVKGGGLPALLAPVLWPAGLLESWLAWSVTFKSASPA